MKVNLIFFLFFMQTKRIIHYLNTIDFDIDDIETAAQVCRTSFIVYEYTILFVEFYWFFHYIFKVETTLMQISDFPIDFCVQGFLVINYSTLFQVNFSDLPFICFSSNSIFLFAASSWMFDIYDILYSIFIKISLILYNWYMWKQLDLIFILFILINLIR